MNTDKETLLNRLQTCTDEELLQMISNANHLYQEEVIQLARETAKLRGLISNFSDEEFKVITAGGRENGPLDVVLIEEIYLKGSINKDTLIQVNSCNKWLPLKDVFQTKSWEQINQQKREKKSANINTEIDNTVVANSNGVKKFVVYEWRGSSI